MADTVEIAIILVIVASLIGLTLHWVHKLLLRLGAALVPYTILIFLAGFLLACFSNNETSLLYDIVISVQTLNPHVLLYLLLPPIILQATLDQDFYLFKNVAAQAIWMAFAGSIFTIAFVTAILYLVIDVDSSHWGFAEILLVATILASTDPVAIVTSLSGLSSSKKLSALLDGESLLNDSVTFVFFVVIIDAVSASSSLTVSSILLDVTRLFLGGLLWGYSFGAVLSFCLMRFYNYAHMEITLLILSMFAVYVFGELIGVSGIISLVIMGLYLSSRGRYAISPKVKKPFLAILEQLNFLATIMIFFLAGMLCYFRVFLDSEFTIDAFSWVVLFLTFFLIVIARGVFIALSFRLMSRLGLGLTKKEAIILAWGGLRGIVPIALVLLVEVDSELSDAGKHLLSFVVDGVVILSLLLLGPTAEPLYRKLGLATHNEYRSVAFQNMIEDLEEKQMISLLKVLENDPFHLTSIWQSVNELIPDFRQLELSEKGVRYSTKPRSLDNIFKSIFNVERMRESIEMENIEVTLGVSDAFTGDQYALPPTQDRNFRNNPVVSSPSFGNHIESEDLEVVRLPSQDRERQVIEVCMKYILHQYESLFDCNEITQNSLHTLKYALRHGNCITISNIERTFEMEWGLLKNKVNSLVDSTDILKLMTAYPIVRYFKRPVVFKKFFQQVEVYYAYIIAHKLLLQEFPSVKILHDLVSQAEQELNHLRSRLPYGFGICQTIIIAKKAIHQKLAIIEKMINMGLLEEQEGDALMSILDSRLHCLMFASSSWTLARLCFERT